MSAIKSWQPALYIAGGLLGLLILGIAALVIVGNWPYRHSESALRTELKRLDATTSATDKFTPGACLDNCPELVRTYHITPAAIPTKTEALMGAFNTAGYAGAFTGSDAAGRHFLATHGRFELFADIITLDPQASPDTVVIRLFDRGEH